MNISKSYVHPVDLLSVEGKIDANNSKELEEILLNTISRGSTKILLDLQGLEYISSSGLRALLMAVKALDKKGVLALCSLQPQVSQIFHISGFDTLFPVYDTREEAVKQMQ